MLNNILNLNGIERLNKQQQQSIQGGRKKCFYHGECTDFGDHCSEIQCSIDFDDC